MELWITLQYKYNEVDLLFDNKASIMKNLLAT